MLAIKCTVQTMHGTMTDLVGRTAKCNLAIFYFNRDITINRLLQFTFWTFYSYDIILTH